MLGLLEMLSTPSSVLAVGMEPHQRRIENYAHLKVMGKNGKAKKNAAHLKAHTVGWPRGKEARAFATGCATRTQTPAVFSPQVLDFDEMCGYMGRLMIRDSNGCLYPLGSRDRCYHSARLAKEVAMAGSSALVTCRGTDLQECRPIVVMSSPSSIEARTLIACRTTGVAGANAEARAALFASDVVNLRDVGAILATAVSSAYGAASILSTAGFGRRDCLSHSSISVIKGLLVLFSSSIICDRLSGSTIFEGFSSSVGNASSRRGRQAASSAVCEGPFIVAKEISMRSYEEWALGIETHWRVVFFAMENNKGMVLLYGDSTKVHEGVVEWIKWQIQHQFCKAVGDSGPFFGSLVYLLGSSNHRLQVAYQNEDYDKLVDEVMLWHNAGVLFSLGIKIDVKVSGTVNNKKVDIRLYWVQQVLNDAIPIVIDFSPSVCTTAREKGFEVGFLCSYLSGDIRPEMDFHIKFDLHGLQQYILNLLMDATEDNNSVISLDGHGNSK
ncbi:hypothetical protein GOP47_0014732 [Adiantum capillus-veneris]|uniref:Uncharacterized protein n=1 Tax=Adiantum capillus-veneris TaxID=13818 RepID=A0A9D4ZCR2_ADICA|nr:hypothetical protein GOP47_0014732 [Adiantum capillus-veneris]